ncbi:MAG: hypothetical protein ACE1Z4_05805, partial [Gammaproteobacteria bacterium]
GAENAPNIAEIHINDDHVKVDLEIFVNDMVSFDQLIPDEFFIGSDIKRPPLAERMRRFSNEGLQVIADQGQKLQASLKLVEPRLRKERPSPFAGKINPYTRQPIPGPPEDKRVLYAELVYPFMKKPKSLTIIPPLDEKGMSQVPISFMTYHQGVPIHVFRYLSEPSTVTLDWDDPWYSGFDKKALKRWQTGGVMSFIYIEPYEVRHEVLARVKDLAAWIDLDLRGNEFIEADENKGLKKRVGEFFLKRSNVLIDGKKLRPILDRTSLVKYSTTASTFLVQPERLPINTAMVGVIITYLTGGMPQEVKNEWDLWSDRIQKVPTNAIDPAGGLPSFVTPEENVHVWKNFLKQYTIPTVEKVVISDSMRAFQIPLGSILCLIILLPVAWQIRKRKQSGKPFGTQVGQVLLLIVASMLLYPYLNVSVARLGFGASRMTNDEGQVILRSLLKNVYRAFDFRDEGDVYDKLAISASGDLLGDLYLQNRKSFRVKQAGGAVARVKKIDVSDVKVQNNPRNTRAFDLRSRWTAVGTVGHWGHLHTRQNQYEARVTIEPVEGAWKITGLELIEEQRIDPNLKPRTINPTAR